MEASSKTFFGCFQVSLLLLDGSSSHCCCGSLKWAWLPWAMHAWAMHPVPVVAKGGVRQGLGRCGKEDQAECGENKPV